MIDLDQLKGVYDETYPEAWSSVSNILDGEGAFYSRDREEFTAGFLRDPAGSLRYIRGCLKSLIAEASDVLERIEQIELGEE
jgi:hypothetical protein